MGIKQKEYPNTGWECWRDGHKRVNDGDGGWHCSECGYTVPPNRPPDKRKK